MEYDKDDFTRSFMERTLELANDYQGGYDARMLVNCRLGLLIVPKEALIEKIPQDPFEKITDWGIKTSSIKNFGRCDHGERHQPNLRQLVRRLRNAVAHFKIKPIPQKSQVSGFKFSDRSGFKAEISLEEIKVFVNKLSEYLKTAA